MAMFSKIEITLCCCRHAGVGLVTWRLSSGQNIWGSVNENF